MTIIHLINAICVIVIVINIAIVVKEKEYIPLHVAREKIITLQDELRLASIHLSHHIHHMHYSFVRYSAHSSLSTCDYTKQEHETTTYSCYWCDMS
jgi:hypothetical protein